MGVSLNILLTSVGRRSYLVKYFKEALGKCGEVHVSNSSAVTPAFHYADHNIVTPLIYDEQYIPFLLNYCMEHKINAIIPLFDIDLPILSSNSKLFYDIGVYVVVSKEDVIDICNDKWKTYQFLINKGFHAPKTYLFLEEAMKALQREELCYPLMVKPRWGMGSIALYIADDEDELRILYNKVKNEIMNTYLKYELKNNIDEAVLIQERLIGQEYGLDIINNLDNEFCRTIVKVKYTMRHGETYCAETVDNPMLSTLGEQISKELEHKGNIDMDVIIVKDIPYVLEMNARFGGGYPFSHLAGVNLPLAIVQWLNGVQVNRATLSEKTGVVGHKDIDLIQI